MLFALAVPVQDRNGDTSSPQETQLIPIRPGQETGLELLEDIDLMGPQDVDKARRSLRDLDQGERTRKRKERKGEEKNKEKPEGFHGFSLSRKLGLYQAHSLAELLWLGIVPGLYYYEYEKSKPPSSTWKPAG
jgi:hypothetical protein